MTNPDSFDSASARPCIPGYQILSELGRGGMGVVYQARHIETNEIRALKTVFGTSESWLAAIHREIRTLAGIQHPGIVAIHDRGEQNGLPWYAMEYVSGLMLHEYLGSRRSEDDEQWWTFSLSQNADKYLPKVKKRHKRRKVTRKKLKQITSLIHAICSPLAYLHGEGIIHKDLKPGNILIRESGVPVIMDFGLISAFSSRDRREVLDDTETRIGTIRYMAPEQLCGEYVDARIDIYALGCIFYEMLTGMVPREATYVMGSEFEDAFPEIPPSSVADGIPAEIDNLVLTMVKRDPNLRIGYALDIACHLAETCKLVTLFQQVPEPRIYLHRPRFTGRTRVLNHLDTRIARTIASMGQIFFIAGESGIGKTRLVMELANRSRVAGITPLLGECYPNRNPQENGHSGDSVLLGAFQKPLESIINMCLAAQEDDLGQIFTDLARTLALYQPLIRSLPGCGDFSEPKSIGTEKHKEILFRNLAALFTRLSRFKSILLLIDDLQWADPYTSEFLEYLLENQPLENSRICVFGTYRSEELTPKVRRLVDHQGGETIILDRMGTDDVHSIVSDMLGFRDIDSSLISRLTEISEGNPFYIAEYLLACVDDHLLVRDPLTGWRLKNTEISQPGRWPEFPESLMRLTANRLNLLDRPARQLVNILSGIGKEISTALLTAVMQKLELTWEHALNELKIRQLIHEPVPGELRFFHDKLRETAYKTQPNETRQKIHRTIAETLESQFPEIAEEHPVTMGSQWENAGMPLKAVPYYETGATRYLERFAINEADKLYEKCLRFTEDELAENARMRIDRARLVYLDNGRYEQALSEYEKVCRDARKISDPDLEADGYNGRLETYGRTGEFDRAAAAGRHALNLYNQTGNHHGAAVVKGNLAMIFARQGRYREAVKLYGSALEIFRETGDVNRRLWVMQNQALSYFSLYETQKSIELLEQVHHLAMQTRHRINAVRALSYQASIHGIIGNPGKAETCSLAAIELNREMGNRQLEALDRVKLARLYANDGRLREALYHARESEPVHREFGDNSSLGQNYLVRGIVSQMQGDLTTAREYFQKSQKIFSDLNYTPMVAECTYKIAVAESNRTSGETQIRQCREALELGRKLQDRDFIMDCLILYHDSCYYSGDRAALDTALSEIHEMLDGMELDPDRTSSWSVMGDLYAALGNRKKALELYETVFVESKDYLQQKPNPGFILQLCRHRRLNGKILKENHRLLNRIGKRIRETGNRFFEPGWLIEKGYLALEEGKSGLYWLNRVRKLVDDLRWDDSAPIRRRVAALDEAVRNYADKTARES